MIVIPRNEQQRAIMFELMRAAGVCDSPELIMIGWVTEGKLVMVVGLDTFIGKTCHIHVSIAKGYTYTPKHMLEFVFMKAFENVSMLVGVVNSNNEAAMKYDKHLGFEESMRFEGMHEDGGDMVILTMRKDQCRYLNMKEAA